eukprot:snap_masked-scaffold_4-processed-gene-11.47-mRNA-1 protein AED:1.00 eAED:1.00 QI:0/-1/0/0/-1/1/1/0/69
MVRSYEIISPNMITDFSSTENGPKEYSCLIILEASSGHARFQLSEGNFRSGCLSQGSQSPRNKYKDFRT